jgi:CheY-like chemotaxis protein
MMDISVPPLRLLLIDDSVSFRQTLARLLRVAGHTVVEAETGAAGLALLRQQPLDLVVTDLDMPGLTGWDVARLAKTTHPHLPVVLVTGGGGCGAPERRMPAPVDAILWKPFPFAELLAVIGRLTGSTPAALGGVADGPATIERATSLHFGGHTPSAPIATDAYPGHLRRRLDSSER